MKMLIPILLDKFLREPIINFYCIVHKSVFSLYGKSYHKKFRKLGERLELISACVHIVVCISLTTQQLHTFQCTHESRIRFN